MTGHIQGVTVCHNTAGLLVMAVCSIRKHHDIPIIIVDGSDQTAAGIECSAAAHSLKSRFDQITVIRPGYNIGHGRGMDLGVNKSTHPHVLLFDTDIIVKKPFLSAFDLRREYYMQGERVLVDDRGYNSEQGIIYIHPHFALLSRKQYFKHRGFANMGAPCLLPMKQLNNGKRHLLVGVDVKQYVLHLERGTRNVIGSNVRPLAIPNTPAM